MVTPTTYVSAVLLLLFSFVCFSIWPNLYKFVGPRWRYELFALDFSGGALLVALVAAYTLGTFGPAISFADQMLIAGRSTGAVILGVGIIFNFGNMLLLASISLLGMAAALPLSIGTALIVLSLFHLKAANVTLSLVGMALVLIACYLAWAAARARSTTISKSITSPGGPKGSNNRKPNLTKGLLLSIVGGLALGVVQLSLKQTSDPEFGPGAYGTLLMLALGILLSTPMFDVFLMHIDVVGGTIGFRNYLRGNRRQHGLGAASGAIWALGALATLLAIGATAEAAPKTSLILIFPAVSVLACVILGAARWKEFAGVAPRANVLLALGAACFAAGLVLIAFALDRV